MSNTMLWIAAGALIALLVAWRLHRANHTLQTILREERDRPDPEPAPGTSDEPVTHDRRTPD